MTELKPQELWAVHWKYITISRNLLSTLDLALISSSKSLTLCSSLGLFSQNTLPLYRFLESYERRSLSMSRPPSLKFNSLTICTSHCLAASSGYDLCCGLECEHVWQWCERKSSCRESPMMLPMPLGHPGSANCCSGRWAQEQVHLLHVSSWPCGIHISFTPSLIPSQLSHLVLSLNSFHQIFKWSFPSQISRTILYPSCSFSMSSIFDS